LNVECGSEFQTPRLGGPSRIGSWKHVDTAGIRSEPEQVLDLVPVKPLSGVITEIGRKIAAGSDGENWTVRDYSGR
jgi:hypothetical protein